MSSNSQFSLSGLIGGTIAGCIRWPWITISVFALLTAASALYSARNFAINTDISNLISQNIDWRQREIALEKAFPARVHTILAVVDAPAPELASLAANTLTELLRARPGLFPEVRRPDGGALFEKSGLLFLPAEQLGATLGQLEAATPFISILASDPSWRGLSQAAQAALGGVEAKQYNLDSLVPIFDRFSATFEHIVADRPASFSWQELLNNKESQPAELRRFVDIVPKLDYSALEPGKEATEGVREAGLDARWNYQARVRLTGSVPISDEEFATVKEGAIVNGIGTVIIVLLILWLALKSARIILAVFLALAGGLAITAALGFLMVGSLNLISVAFFVLFVGLGVDFCIQYSVRYRDERYHRGELKAALVDAGRNVGGPLALAAGATAAGFLAFLPTHYQGVSELGAIAGVGMIVAFLISITVLPALLALLDPPGEKEPLGYSSFGPADGFVDRNRRWVVAGTLGIAVLGLPLLYFLRFDFNPINLRDSSVESIATYLELRQDPNAGASAINILAGSLGEARAVAAKIAKLPEVERAMTIHSFVPDDQQTKLGLIRKAAPGILHALDVRPVPAPSPREIGEILVQTAGALDDAAAQSGTGPGVNAAKRLAGLLRKLAAASDEKRAAAERAIMVPLHFKFAEMRKLLQAGLVTVDTLPADLKDVWVTADGKSRVEVFPKGDPNDNETLRTFARKVLEVEPRAIGGPISILKSGDTIVVAFIQAGALALVTICLLLWLALRRLDDVLLTVVPLLLAGVITMELCVLLDLPLNFANIIALPLLLGIGVAFKIYYIMSWRAGQTNLLQSSLTRAVIFSALTTATAFGSLWLSSHPGTSSLGKLLALSLVTTMCAAVLFQPALMGRPRDAAADAGTDGDGRG